jgi:hypothetical protein
LSFYDWDGGGREESPLPLPPLNSRPPLQEGYAPALFVRREGPELEPYPTATHQDQTWGDLRSALSQLPSSWEAAALFFSVSRPSPQVSYFLEHLERHDDWLNPRLVDLHLGQKGLNTVETPADLSRGRSSGKVEAGKWPASWKGMGLREDELYALRGKVLLWSWQAWWAPLLCEDPEHVRRRLRDQLQDSLLEEGQNPPALFDQRFNRRLNEEHARVEADADKLLLKMVGLNGQGEGVDPVLLRKRADIGRLLVLLKKGGARTVDASGMPDNLRELWLKYRPEDAPLLPTPLSQSPFWLQDPPQTVKETVLTKVRRKLRFLGCEV